MDFKREDEKEEARQRILEEQKYYKEMGQDDQEETMNWSLQDEQFYEKKDQFSSKINY